MGQSTNDSIGPAANPQPDFFEGSRKPGAGPTLQKTFTVAGDVQGSALTDVVLQFSYRAATAVQTPSDLNPGYSLKRSADQASTRLLQPLTSAEYHVAIGIDSILPAATGNAPFELLKFYNYAAVPGSNTYKNLALDIDVSAASEDGTPLGSLGTLHAYFGIKNFCKADALGRPYDPEEAGFTANEPAPALNFVQRNIFFVNRDVFESIAENVLRDGAHNYNEKANLLNIIGYMIDLSSGTPVRMAKISDYGMAAITQNADNTGKLAEFLIAAVDAQFDALFDFPLSTAGIRLTNVSGNVTITGTEDLVLTRADFARYDLSIEYEALDEDGDVETRTIHLDWTRDASNTDSNNMVSFSFSQENFIVSAAPGGPVTVTVRTLDTMVVWQKEYAAGSAALGNLSISLPLQGSGAVKPSERNIPNPKRLRGQILDMTRSATLTNALVLIQVKAAGDADWRTAGSALSDKEGYFSLPYPFGNYVSAQAAVSLNPDSPAAIQIHALTADNQTLADDFLFLQLNAVKPRDTTAGTATPDDCDCHDNLKATRLPDQADLIHSDEYTQDLGAGCINLSTPNRTLREYSYNAIVRTSDPDVANYSLVKVDAAGNYKLQGEGKKRKRKSIDLSNPVDWHDIADETGLMYTIEATDDYAPPADTNLSFYQAVTVATGHILHYKSQFKADGYSLGELLYSLPLAPGQKKQIVVFDSSHQLQGAESQQMSVSEQLANNLVNDRDITDQLGGSISENLSGRSKAETAGVSAAAGAAGSAGAFGASVGVAGGYAMGSSDASQDSARNISQFFSEKLRNGLMQNANSYRQQNASVVSTVTEGQKYAATTEVVANHNHCHSLTMMYFEVLKHYAIYQELSNVEECVFVPLLLTNFTQRNVMKWRDVLADNLLPLPSNTYLPSVNGQHPLVPGFDANERMLANWTNVDYPETSYDQEPVRNIKGSLSLRVVLNRPKTRYDRIISFPIVEKKHEVSGWEIFGNILLAPFTGGIPVLGTSNEHIQVRQQLFDSFMTMDANWQAAAPADCIRITNFEPVPVPSEWLKPIGIDSTGYSLSGSHGFFEDGFDSDKEAWRGIANLLGFREKGEADDDDRCVLRMMNKYFKGKLISEWDTIYYRDIAPELVENLVHKLQLTEVSDDLKTPIAGLNPSFTALNRYYGGEAIIRINVYGSTNKQRGLFAHNLRLSGSAGVSGLSNLATIRLENASLRYSTPHFDGILYEGYLGQDIFEGAILYIPETNADKRNPRQEDRFIVTRLLDHLNSNLEHYNKALWYNLDADRRYMLLDGFHIQVYNDNSVPIGLKSLASVIKNDLVTVAGNSLVFPVAAGFRVGRSYLIEQTETGGAEKVSLLDHYKPITPPQPYRLSVPTKGLFVEAVKGMCDSCEKVEDNTSQDWDKFKTDEPTAINSLTAPTPTVTDWKATFKDIATATLRVQDAQTEPTPGAGLQGLSDALTKSNTFRDVTGLSGNQSNAAATYKANTAAAVKMAETAKSMATQENSAAKNEQITSSIKDAMKNGDISEEAGKKLLEKHYNNLVDGGSSARAEAKQAAKKGKKDKPSLTDSAVKGAADGADVKATKTDKKGNTESVEIKNSAKSATTDAASSVLAEVKGGITMLSLEAGKKMAEWAPVSATLMQWKDGKKLSVADRMKALGSDFATAYAADKNLPCSLRDNLISNMGADSQEWDGTLAQLISLMNAHGAIWIATDSQNDKGSFSNCWWLVSKIEDTEGDSSDATLTLCQVGTFKFLTKKFSDVKDGMDRVKDATSEAEQFCLTVVFYDDKPAAADDDSSDDDDADAADTDSSASGDGKGSTTTGKDTGSSGKDTGSDSKDDDTDTDDTAGSNDDDDDDTDTGGSGSSAGSSGAAGGNTGTTASSSGSSSGGTGTTATAGTAAGSGGSTGMGSGNTGSTGTTTTGAAPATDPSKFVVDTDAKYSFKNERATFRKLKDDTVVFYKGILSVDADGTPDAYHLVTEAEFTYSKAHRGSKESANSKKGKDNLFNGIGQFKTYAKIPAGYVKGKDYETILGKNYALHWIKGEPYFVTGTSLTAGGDPYSPDNYVNALEIPYVVFPAKVYANYPTNPGDFCLVYDIKKKQTRFAIFGDCSGNKGGGEASVKLVDELGYANAAKDGRKSTYKGGKNILYVAFGHTGNQRPRSYQEIQETGAALLKKYGGQAFIDRLVELTAKD